MLNVLIEIVLYAFQSCYEFYTSGEVGQDSDGMDNQCRWCGEGGNLIVCDYCHNAFCKSCVRRNFGRAAVAELERGKFLRE